jgi:hypothetical protein
MQRAHPPQVRRQARPNGLRQHRSGRPRTCRYRNRSAAATPARPSPAVRACRLEEFAHESCRRCREPGTSPGQQLEESIRAASPPAHRSPKARGAPTFRHLPQEQTWVP